MALTPEDRYQRDPLFRTMVDQLEYYVRAAVFSGTEIREAAMLALIHHEMTTLRPMMILPDGTIRPIFRPPPVRPSMITSQTIEELRAAVAEGAGHDCSEWRGRDWPDQSPHACALCGRQVP